MIGGNFCLHQSYVNKYQRELRKSNNGILSCKLCYTDVKCGRKSTVDAHRLTKIHTKQLKRLETTSTVQASLTSDKNDFTKSERRIFLTPRQFKAQLN